MIVFKATIGGNHGAKEIPVQPERSEHDIILSRDRNEGNNVGGGSSSGIYTGMFGSD